MDVLRVEDKRAPHLGPYNNTRSIATELFGYQLGMAHTNLDHPDPLHVPNECPMSSKKAQRITRVMDEYFSFNVGPKFGFVDKGQAFKWFNEPERKKLADLNFVLAHYDVPEADVLVCKHQAMYLKDHAVLTGTEELYADDHQSKPRTSATKGNATNRKRRVTRRVSKAATN